MGYEGRGGSLAHGKDIMWILAGVSSVMLGTVTRTVLGEKGFL